MYETPSSKVISKDRRQTPPAVFAFFRIVNIYRHFPKLSYVEFVYKEGNQEKERGKYG